MQLARKLGRVSLHAAARQCASPVEVHSMLMHPPCRVLRDECGVHAIGGATVARGAHLSSESVGSTSSGMVGRPLLPGEPGPSVAVCRLALEPCRDTLAHALVSFWRAPEWPPLAAVDCSDVSEPPTLAGGSWGSLRALRWLAYCAAMPGVTVKAPAGRLAGAPRGAAEGV